MDPHGEQEALHLRGHSIARGAPGRYVTPTSHVFLPHVVGCSLDGWSEAELRTMADDEDSAPEPPPPPPPPAW